MKMSFFIIYTWCIQTFINQSSIYIWRSWASWHRRKPAYNREFAEDRNDVESTDIENEQVNEVESTSLTCPSLAELDEAIEVVSRLSLYSEDRELNPLKLEAKLNTRRLQKFRQATIT